MAIIVTDLGYGDAGKGTIVDYLSRQVERPIVVRHSGGSQAAHNVVTPNGRHHTFASFGSGSFMLDAKTFLSRYMMVNPVNMLFEADHLVECGLFNIWTRTFVSGNALVITPWHIAANRLRELARGDSRHGSCGQGISEVQRDLLADSNNALRVRDLTDGNSRSLRSMLRDRQAAKVRQLRTEGVLPNDALNRVTDGLSLDIIGDLTMDYQQWLSSITVVDDDFLGHLASSGELIFEGSQGVLLDENFGFHPHTTWSTTTAENALTLLGEIGYTGKITKLGVMRAYATRHGNGPFVTEDASLKKLAPEVHNRQHPWSGEFRLGHLDLVAHRYAVQANNGIDQVAVTCLDRLRDWQVCRGYDISGEIRRDLSFGRKGDLAHQEGLTRQLLTAQPLYQSVDSEAKLLDLVEEWLGASVAVTSHGMSALDKQSHQFKV
jgi:adenylosuccinate synthase